MLESDQAGALGRERDQEAFGSNDPVSGWTRQSRIFRPNSGSRRQGRNWPHGFGAATVIQTSHCPTTPGVAHGARSSWHAGGHVDGAPIRTSPFSTPMCGYLGVAVVHVSLGLGNDWKNVVLDAPVFPACESGDGIDDVVRDITAAPLSKDHSTYFGILERMRMPCRAWLLEFIMLSRSWNMMRL